MPQNEEVKDRLIDGVWHKWVPGKGWVSKGGSDKSTGQLREEYGVKESKPAEDTGDCDKLTQKSGESALVFASRKAKCRQAKNKAQSEGLK